MPRIADRISEKKRQPKRGRGMLSERMFLFTRGAAGMAIWKLRRAFCFGLLVLTFGVVFAFLARTVVGTGRVVSFTMRFMCLACSCSRRKRTSSARESSFLVLMRDSERYATCGRGRLCVLLPVRSSGQPILYRTTHWLPKVWDTY